MIEILTIIPFEYVSCIDEACFLKARTSHELNRSKYVIISLDI